MRDGREPREKHSCRRNSRQKHLEGEMNLVCCQCGKGLDAGGEQGEGGRDLGNLLAQGEVLGCYSNSTCSEKPSGGFKQRHS